MTTEQECLPPSIYTLQIYQRCRELYICNTLGAVRFHPAHLQSAEGTGPASYGWGQPAHFHLTEIESPWRCCHHVGELVQK